MSFESNKILGAFLGTCLLLIAIGTLADLIYKKTDSIPMSKEVISYKISPNLDTSINIEENNVITNDLSNQENIVEKISQANVESGFLYSKKCTACHSFDKSRTKKIGPPLIDVYEREIANIDNYNYSKSLQKLSGKWDLQSLDGFLKDPKEWAPGTKMSFVGIKNINDRANIIAYLKSLINK